MPVLCFDTGMVPSTVALFGDELLGRLIAF